MQVATAGQFFISYTIRTFGALTFAIIMTTRQVKRWYTKVDIHKRFVHLFSNMHSLNENFNEPCSVSEHLAIVCVVCASPKLGTMDRSCKHSLVSIYWFLMIDCCQDFWINANFLCQATVFGALYAKTLLVAKKPKPVPVLPDPEIAMEPKVESTKT